MTQAQLAKKLGYVDSTISHWEKGDRRVGPDELQKIADVFGIGIECLLDRTERKWKHRGGIHKIVDVRSFKDEIKPKQMVYKFIVASAFLAGALILEPVNMWYMGAVFLIGSLILLIDVIAIVVHHKTVVSYVVDAYETVTFAKKADPPRVPGHRFALAGRYGLFLFMGVFVYSLFFAVIHNVGVETYLPPYFVFFMLVFIGLVLAAGVLEVKRWHRAKRIAHKDFKYRADLVVHKCMNVLSMLAYVYMYLGTHYYQDLLDDWLVWFFRVSAPLLVIFSHELHVRKLRHLSEYGLVLE